jgi:Pyruvate/2-oxoacid:ferredoxin oxidoreductase delta subunit
MKQYKYKHRTKGLGIHNWIKSKTAVTPGSWDMVLNFFKVLLAGSKVSRIPVLGYMYEFLMQVRPDKKKFTKGVLLNLNEALTDKSEGVIMPVDLMKKAIRETSYIAIMNRCICRDAQDCSTYPKDHGCIFIGNGARVLEERSIGRKATVEEALAHIDRGVELGLIGQSLWIEMEQYIWGMKEEDMHRFLEICFCCPCCCTALKLAKNASDIMRKRFISVGWKAVVKDRSKTTCGNCQVCTDACPVEAISNNSGYTYINMEKCAGCGICASKCPKENIKLELIEETKEDIKEYFHELDLEL